MEEKGLALSPHAIRPVLRRNGFRGHTTKRKAFYPALPAWDEEKPFTLAQVDVKDVPDKGALGTNRWDHRAKRRFSRYLWTFLEGRTRLRFLAWSHEITLTNGLCFMGLGMRWVRGHGIGGELVWPTDWGEEFGGSNPQKLHRLQERYYAPLGARLARIPLGKKEHNGRVERSHRTDDEGFDLPFLDQVPTEAGFLHKAAGWVCSYNLERPHYGEGMDGKPPFQVLRELGHGLPREVALFPPLALGRISADWALRVGNDLPAHCTGRFHPTSGRLGFAAGATGLA